MGNLKKSHWLIDAACKDEDPKLFMSYDKAHIEKAKNICKDCSVKKPCLEQFFEIDCIAGGYTLLERMKRTWHRIESLDDDNWS